MKPVYCCSLLSSALDSMLAFWSRIDVSGLPCLPQIIPLGYFFWWVVGDHTHAALVPCFLRTLCLSPPTVGRTFHAQPDRTLHSHIFLMPGTYKFPSVLPPSLTLNKSRAKKLCKSISATFIISYTISYEWRLSPL